MIALTGEEEHALRRLQECLDVKPPLVNMLRRATADYIQNILIREPALCKKWNARIEQERRAHLKLTP